MPTLIHKFKLLTHKISEDDLMPWASMLTIYLLLSLFPIIMIITELISRFSLANPAILNYWTDLLPTDVYTTLRSIAEELVIEQDSTIIPTAVIITLWSASRGIMAIIKALNKAYGIRERRGYIRLRLLALSYTLGLILLIVITLSLIVFGNNIFGLVERWIALPAILTTLFAYLRYGLTVLFSLIFFIGLYNLCPSEKSGFYKVLPGALLASIGLIGISTIFSVYINYFSNLSYLYGSLTSFIIVILWLFIVSVVIMVGGEVNAVFSTQLLSSKENESTSPSSCKKP